VNPNPQSPAPGSYSASSSATSGVLPEDPKPQISPPPPAPAKRASQAEIWARRMFLVTFVLLCTLLGVFLIVLPWRPEWTDNPLLFGFPWLKSIFAHPFFRGICSGFGVLDLWIAISETAHYHEDI
jgi:hypothetical protein